MKSLLEDWKNLYMTQKQVSLVDIAFHMTYMELTSKSSFCNRDALRTVNHCQIARS